ncbi:MAG: hypothetical protein ACP5SP_07970, partial [Caldisericum sp.]|uniref:hypothetical protein n=1 Tax=Caldisericum sp. TaxID=2499687 RepID=UPI003D0C769F
MRNINPMKKSSDYRGLKYIILHHSATDYQANKEDITGEIIAKSICKSQSERWHDEYPNYKCDYH